MIYLKLASEDGAQQGWLDQANPFALRVRSTKLIALCACAALAAATMTTRSAIAHEGQGQSAESKTALADTAEGILQKLQQHHAEATAAVKGKNLKDVHAHAEAMTALAKVLPGKVADEKKERVQGAANNLTRIVDIMHHAADEGDQVRAAIELKKLEGVMTSLDQQLK